MKIYWATFACLIALQCTLSAATHVSKDRDEVHVQEFWDPYEVFEDNDETSQSSEESSYPVHLRQLASDIDEQSSPSTDDPSTDDPSTDDPSTDDPSSPSTDDPSTDDPSSPSTEDPSIPSSTPIVPSFSPTDPPPTTPGSASSLTSLSLFFMLICTAICKLY